MNFEIIDLGITDYEQSLLLQKQFQQKRQTGIIRDTLLLMEYAPVITLGRSADYAHILAHPEYLKQKKIKIIKASRGGEVTIHLPGQIVAYPIFDLRIWGKDIHLFIRKLEQVMLEYLSIYKIFGQTIKGFSGAWVNDQKIGFIGISISRWVSCYGLSLNVNCNLDFFSLIVPCGIKDKKITSVENILGKKVPFAQAKINFCQAFKNVFNNQ
ncbi:MAG: lipoyl(octanoyl) transferase [Candidatus Omnitrophota bacterium]|nr:MAG: lipoyl(octanoyl) transferase [Candidatus Omnitrophota bacterium]